MKISDIDREKLQVLDRVFQLLDKEALMQLVSHELVISRLKGTTDTQGILESFVSDNYYQNNSISSLVHSIEELKIDNVTLRSDMVILIKLINATLVVSEPRSSDFSYIKSKYGIY